MKDNGGQAFPGERMEWVGRVGCETHELRPVGGMTLRDYFAAKALAGGITATGLGGLSAQELSEVLRPFARICYAAADAMIAERAK